MPAASNLALLAPTDLDTSYFQQDATTHKFKLLAAGVKSVQTTYTFGLDSTTNKLTLYDNTGAAISAVDPHTFEASLSNASISNGVITFKDSSGNVTGTLDTTVFLQAVNLTVGNGLAPLASGANGTNAKPITLSLLSDPVAGNILKVSATGVSVNTADIQSIINGMVFSATVSAAAGGLTITLGSRSILVPGVVAQDAAGNNLGIMLTYAA